MEEGDVEVHPGADRVRAQRGSARQDVLRVPVTQWFNARLGYPRHF